MVRFLLFVYECFIGFLQISEFLTNFQGPPNQLPNTFFMSLDHQSKRHFDNMIRNEELP